MIEENGYGSINDITYGWAFIDNLDHIALIIILSILGIVAFVIFCVCYSECKEDGDLIPMTSTVSGVFIGVSLLFMIIGAGANLHSERRLAMENNIHMKYDVDLVDILHVQREGKTWLAEGHILSSEDGLNIGFGDEAIQENDADTFSVVFDMNGEPKILPWAGASNEDINKLLIDHDEDSIQK